MPLEFLIAMVSIGLLLVFLAVVSFGSPQGRLQISKESAARQFKIEYPDFDVNDAILDVMGRGAVLIQKRGEAIGLVYRHGGRVVNRLVDSRSMRSFEMNDPEITIRLKDLTLRKVTFLIESHVELESIRLGLAAIEQSGHKNP